MTSFLTWCGILLCLFNGMIVETQAAKCSLPDLPESFSASMQFNANLMERRGKDGPQYEGVSHGIQETCLKTEKARIDYISEYNLVDGDVVVTNDNIIWNPDIGGIKNFLHINTIQSENEKGVAICRADLIPDDPILRFAFGLDPENPTYPSLVRMLHFGPGENYTCDGPAEPVDGIPVFKYTGYIENTDVNANLKVEYYWSDPVLWKGTAGVNRSMPVQARITGKGDFSGNHEGLETVDVTVSFSEYLAVEIDPDAFRPPRDIYCENRKSTLKLPELPSAFHFNAELIYFFHNEDDSIKEFVISPRQEWYDYSAKVSRSDYKPVDPSNPNNPFDGATGFVSEIKDFKSGISYVTRLDSGECHPRKISSEEGSDIHHNEDGTISMTSPFEYWNYDNLSFASNGIFDERGIDAEFYVSDLIPGKVVDGIQFNRTQIFALTTGVYLTEGGSELEFNVPIRIESYPMERYWSTKTRIVYNVMGFEYFLPDFNTYDITSCFEGDKMDHRLIRIGWVKNMDVKGGIKIIRDQIRTQASIGAKVSLIRIQNIEINLEKEDKAIVAIFTIVDYPSDFGKPSDDLPPESTLPLSTAVDNLRNYIADKKFVIEIPVMEDKSRAVVSASADPNVFEALDRNEDVETSKKRYSPGEMFGLAVGMIILGGLLGGVIYHFGFRKKQLPDLFSSSASSIRGYDNPLKDVQDLS